VSIWRLMQTPRAWFDGCALRAERSGAFSSDSGKAREGSWAAVRHRSCWRELRCLAGLRKCMRGTARAPPRGGLMQALTYHGAHDVRVESVPDPIIQAPDDVILRVTATAICGSDLHLYRGKIPQVKDGDIFGHEFMGVVEEVGPAVTAVAKGDRVIIPFVIACGECFFCQMDLTAACETTNSGRGAILNKKQIPPGAALFGYSHLYGGVPGGQAEYVRVPKGNV